jgi:tetratricopeptide (TPR) repeat protein
MPANLGISLTRSIVVAFAVVCLALAAGACRRSNKNANINGSAGQSNGSNEEQAKALVDQGKELYKNDQDEQAIVAFQKAISLQPDLAEAHLRLGMAFAALERKPEAEEEYKKTIELYKKVVQSDSKDVEAFFNLGEAHSFLHQDESAANDYRQATRLKPDDEEAFYQLGKAETRLANYTEAVAAFQKALELDPTDSRAVEALDNAREGVQRIKEGKKHAEDELKKQQANANANANLNSNSKNRPTPKPGLRRF